MARLDSAALARALALRDLTDSALGAHAMQLVLAGILRALSNAWGCPVLVHRASPIVSAADNYDRLRYPPDGAARDKRYTRWIDEHTLLRTQTSAMIPPLLDAIASARYDDVLLACPGLVYRRDAIDRLHTGEPHQLDLWRLARRPVDVAALTDMIARVVAAVLPGAEWRATPAKHPYTLDGRQIDVRVGDAWIEIGECGLALTALLEECGHAGAHGLAMGLGLDRLLMLRKRIDDIRLLRSSDSRVAAQMNDLEPWRPVSSQPAAIRDLSIAVAPDRTLEELGDRVRGALSERADAVEAIDVLAETPGASLTEAARARLGLALPQKNLLVRVALRHPTRTLTADEANTLRDDVYASVHEGTQWTWAAARSGVRGGTKGE